VTDSLAERTLTLIGAPTSAGAYAPGQEDAPAALREHRLADELRRLGAYVNDAGDTPRWRWRPDPSNPTAQNAPAVAEGAQAVAALVAAALADNTLPLVLGWMGVAHMLGEPDTVDEVVSLGPRRPLLSPDRLVLFGHDPEHSTSWERERISHHGLYEIRVQEIAADPGGAARRALEAATADAERYLVHFDVDSIDFIDMPLSENPGRNYGLTFEAAMAALDVLLSDDRLLALTVSELNPHHGAEDGSTVREFAERLAVAIAGGGPAIDK
jgi:arginase